jgi:hypothetical protein
VKIDRQDEHDFFRIEHDTSGWSNPDNPEENSVDPVYSAN